MPNIVQLWDFEDGTTQGWSLNSDSAITTSLDDTGALQGTYSIKTRVVSDTTDTHMVASISGVDLSGTTKPTIAILIKRIPSGPQYFRGGIEVIVRDSGGTPLIDVYHQLKWVVDDTTYYFVSIIDISAAAGQSNLTIEIYLNPANGSGIIDALNDFYFDQIAIIDGADYEYNTGIMLSDNSPLSLSLSIPSTDGDLTGITAAKMGLSLATPDWAYTQLKASATTDQASLTIDSDDRSTKHLNYVEPASPASTFTKLTLYGEVNVGSYAGWMEKIAVVFLGTDWSYQRIYLFNVYYTANGVSPRYANVIHTSAYGSTASGSKDVSFKAHGTGLEIALKAKYLVGDPTLLSSGSITLTVYNNDKSTNYGSVTLDLTTASEQTSSYITGLPTDTDLILTFNWSITANARVVILAYPMVKVY